MAVLSVIIPCHNDVRHIADAIRSVLAQSIRPDEIVVVDDGSSDGSAEAAARFGRAVTVVRRDNGGVAAARNTGVMASRGRLLAFLDADDIWPAGSLACRFEIAELERADIVYGRVRQVRADGTRLGPDTFGRLAGAVMLTRGVFERVGPFDESLRTAETIDWFARAGEAGVKQVACDDVVLHRRIHETNMMRTTPSPERDCLQVLRQAMQRRRAAGSIQ